MPENRSDVYVVRKKGEIDTRKEVDRSRIAQVQEFRHSTLINNQQKGDQHEKSCNYMPCVAYGYLSGDWRFGGG